MRERRESKARARFDAYSKIRNAAGGLDQIPRARKGSSKPIARSVVRAPKHFSLFGNYEETNAFLNEVRDLLTKGKKIFVELSPIQETTVETVLVLLAIIKDVGGRKSSKRVNAAVGNTPLAESVAGRMFLQSGFFEHVPNNVPPKQLEGCQGTMGTRKGTRVSTDLADGLTKKAAEAVFGKRRYLPGVYRTFIELMGNTRQHANPKEEQTELWWAMVYVDKAEQSAQFAFYDAGVGIPRSFRGRMAELLATLGLGQTDPELLMLLIEGKLRSRTKLNYRGKGLPAIAKALERGQIGRLRILTNGVMAHVEKNRFTPLAEPFLGSLISWELKPHNDHYKDQ